MSPCRADHGVNPPQDQKQKKYKKERDSLGSPILQGEGKKQKENCRNAIENEKPPSVWKSRLKEKSGLHVKKKKGPYSVAITRRPVPAAEKGEGGKDPNDFFNPVERSKPIHLQGT